MVVAGAGDMPVSEVEVWLLWRHHHAMTTVTKPTVTGGHLEEVVAGPDVIEGRRVDASEEPSALDQLVARQLERRGDRVEEQQCE